MQSYLFTLAVHASVVINKNKHCHIQCNEAFLLCFLLEVLQFQSYIQVFNLLRLNFCVGKDLTLLFRMWISSFLNIICLKELSFFILMLRFFQFWPVGFSSSWILCPFDTSPSFFEHICSLDHIKRFQAHLVLSQSWLWSQPFLPRSFISFQWIMALTTPRSEY